MKAFESVLFFANGVPEPESALRRALELAGDGVRKFTVIDVVERPHGLIRQLLRTTQFKDLETTLREARRSELEKAVETATGGSLRIDVLVEAGTPFLEVIREAQRGRYDLLMTSEPVSGEAEAQNLGSTNLHLLRKCPTPVWVLGRGRKRKLDRVLAAIDPGDGQNPRSGLSRRILTLAAAEAQRAGAELHVLHAWTLYGETQLRFGLARVPEAKIQPLLEEAEERSRLWLEEVVREHVPSTVSCRTHLVQGEAKDVIPELARRRRIDLIVMGTLGRAGVPGLLIGNTAENVLGRIQCSVLAVKPRGFRTPVKT